MNPDYLQRVLGVALLSHAEESVLAERFRTHGDEAARNTLVNAHLRLVPPIARRYWRAGASLSDLIAEGNCGLLHASEKFEPDRGNRFATYAMHWIRARVSECAVRNSSSAIRPPRSLRSVRREHNRATNLVGDDREARRIVAERLRMGASTVDDLVDFIQRRRVSFQSVVADGSDRESALCAREPNPEEAMLRKTSQQALEVCVQGALATLNSRERRIVEQRLMADDGASLTLLELGQEFGVSRERVRQVEVTVKRKLLTQLRASMRRAAPPTAA